MAFLCVAGFTLAPLLLHITFHLKYLPYLLSGYQYYMAVRIPNGSTYIHISETTPSSANYIAMRAQESNVFINGNFRVLYSGQTNFSLAGSAWQYERAQSNGAEVVETDGPVAEDISVYVLATHKYRGISYTFSLPKAKMNSLTSPVYFWKPSAWQTCDAICGSGKQKRTVACSKLSPGGIVQVAAAELCVLDKPSLTQECSLEECEYSWVASEWGRCNATCNGIGMRTRTVACQKRTSRGVSVAAVANRKCIDAPPGNSQSCSGEACLYQWEAGSWGSCDAICGPGWKERKVTCVRITGEGKTKVEPHLCKETTLLSKDECQSPVGSCSDFHWQSSLWSKVLQ